MNSFPEARIRQGYLAARFDGYIRPVHIALAEKALGKPLPKGAVVHHADGNKLNNSTDNLVILQSHAFHKIIHARMKRLKDTGSLELKRCAKCKNVKPIPEFVRSKSWDKSTSWCRKCLNLHYRRLGLYERHIKKTLLNP